MTKTTMTKLPAGLVAAAIAQAKERDDDWQAIYCEIAMIPAVQEAWRKANKNRPLSIQRVDGIPHKDFYREANIERGQSGTWHEVSGYVFDLGGAGIPWNRVRPDGYSHSASRTWEGVCRETHYSVIETVKYAYDQIGGGKPMFGQNWVAVLREYGIEMTEGLL